MLPFRPFSVLKQDMIIEACHVIKDYHSQGYQRHVVILQQSNLFRDPVSTVSKQSGFDVIIKSNPNLQERICTVT